MGSWALYFYCNFQQDKPRLIKRNLTNYSSPGRLQQGFTDMLCGAKDCQGNKHYFASKGHTNSMPYPEGEPRCHFY